MKILLFAILLILFLPSIVLAQFQTVPLSGNNPGSYQCIGFDSPGPGANAITRDAEISNGRIVCNGVFDKNGNVVAPILKPPTLQQLEIWFVRIVYAIWAIIATLSFVMLIYLGYRYMLRGGTSDQELVKLRKDIFNYVIGVILVFLAVPILTTIFRLMGINNSVQCYNVLNSEVGIGFQFFFPELCTDPRMSIVSDPCSLGRSRANGMPCNEPGYETPDCAFSPRIPDRAYYVCNQQRVWEYRER